ncbi:MAG: gliding motility protein GldL [Muribaculaceae bacterium]|nr:gliding motility protein GldL [Muribaculaceae bacterium]
MEKIRRYRNCVERFISSDEGQRFFNFAYSIGAAVVIWGALFKILHLPGGDVLLSVGMCTEVLMFILTAFDRPPKDYRWEDVFPELAGDDPMESRQQRRNAVSSPVAAPVLTGDTGADVAAVTGHYIEQMKAIGEQLDKLHQTTVKLNSVSDTILHSYDAITGHSDEITSSADGYARQMQALSRNIQGLNTIYEIHLKSVSGQLDAIDRVNKGMMAIRDMYERSAAQSSRYAEETERMTRQMEQLNSIYEKMLRAMTVNMNVTAGQQYQNTAEN